MPIVEPSTGIEVHRYGAHLFHTSNERVWEYANRFTAFTGYRHRVLSIFKGRVYPMPINLGTICAYFGRAMGPAEARALMTSYRETLARAGREADRLAPYYREMYLKAAGRDVGLERRLH